MSWFLFLEILDPEVHAVVNGLRSEFNKKPMSNGVHITVRGPYKKKIPSKSIENFRRKIADDLLVLQSAGIFENENDYAVYIKINSENLKKIWWKPDYPIDKYGYNPHITLYSGDNKEFAHKIFSFLKKENIKLGCRDFRLKAYSSKQGSFLIDGDLPKEKHFLELSNRRMVKPDLIQRAANLVRDTFYKKN